MKILIKKKEDIKILNSYNMRYVRMINAIQDSYVMVDTDILSLYEDKFLISDAGEKEHFLTPNRIVYTYHVAEIIDDARLGLKQCRSCYERSRDYNKCPYCGSKSLFEFVPGSTSVSGVDELTNKAIREIFQLEDSGI